MSGGAVLSEARDLRTVLIVEDERTVAEALAVVIDLQPDLTCVATAETLTDAFASVETLHPGLVLMDVGLPDGDGIEGAKRIIEEYPGIQVVVLTCDASFESIERARAAGVSSYLFKDAPLPTLMKAIRSPAGADTFLDLTAVATLVQRARTYEEPTPPVQLTGRERQVLALMADGLDPRSIGRVLDVSVYTARGHVQNILLKLNAHSQLSAVAKARKLGLI